MDLLPGSRERSANGHESVADLSCSATLSMPGAYGKSVPLRDQTTRDIWIGILWFFAAGLLLLYWTLPMMIPWRLTPAAIFLVGVLVLIEGFVCRGVWRAAAELVRRKKETK